MKKPNKISGREITDPKFYFNRRTFIQAGVMAASAVATWLIYRQFNQPASGKVKTARIEGLTTAPAAALFNRRLHEASAKLTS